MPFSVGKNTGIRRVLGRDLEQPQNPRDSAATAAAVNSVHLTGRASQPSDQATNPQQRTSLLFTPVSQLVTGASTTITNNRRKKFFFF